MTDNLRAQLRICFLILASDDPINEIDREAQSKTWCRDLPSNVDVLWVRGHTGSDYLLEGNILYVPCQEGYSRILEKTVLASTWAYNNLMFDFLIRTNVSTYFNLTKLEKDLEKKAKKMRFFGGFPDYTKHGNHKQKDSELFICGTGLYFSRDVLNLLTQLDCVEYAGIPDDVAISRFLFRGGIEPVGFSRCNLHSTHIYFNSSQVRLKSSAISELASKRFYLVHRLNASLKLQTKIAAYLLLTINEIVHLHFTLRNFRDYLNRNFHIARVNFRLLPFQLKKVRK